jgi:hypothetical protein
MPYYNIKLFIEPHFLPGCGIYAGETKVFVPDANYITKNNISFKTLIKRSFSTYNKSINSIRFESGSGQVNFDILELDINENDVNVIIY